MTKNLSGLRPYKKGQSGCPGGRGKYSPTVPKIFKTYTATLISETYNKLINLSHKEIAEISRSLYDHPIIEVVVAKAILREWKDGTLHRTETVLDRIIGKVPQKQELSGASGAPLMPPQIVITKHESLPEPVQPPPAG